MRQSNRFIAENEARIDRNNSCYYPNLIAQRWLGIRLVALGNGVVSFAALFSVLNSNTSNPISAGEVGLSITYALSITQTLSWLLRQSTDLETHIVAVERIKEYIDVEQEAPRHLTSKTSSGWPQKGRIRFDNFTVRYRPDLPLVLQGITCTIEGGEKIGVVGRTGAGKSSLTLALFRIIERACGTIFIDDVDIATIGLQELRSNLTIIPQDPVLFSGTLRSNLDPFETYSDREIWSALEHSHLNEWVRTQIDLLEVNVAEEGSNMSVGQRQLVCLARALLKNETRILILDEATAAIDLETDEFIQRTIRQEFAHCTVVTIAHRINTIMDSSRVMVLQEGRIAEFASPEELLRNEGSEFYKLCRNANVALPSAKRASGGNGDAGSADSPSD